MSKKPQDEITRPLDKIVIRFCVRCLIFLTVWCIGCFVADYFVFSNNPWTMVWGYFMGTVALEVRNIVHG